MKNSTKKILRFITRQLNGFLPCASALKNVFRSFNFIKAPFVFFSDCIKYMKLSKNESMFKFKISNLYPILYDRYEKAGNMPLHYFFQDLWAAKKVYKSGIKNHYDIGSRLDGFIAHCLSFCEVTMLDIRPLNTKIDNLAFLEADCTNMLNIRTNSIDSLSSLHAVEHFGLGRYGDMVNPNGYKKAIQEMQRITKAGGDIYFSVPIGKQRVEFNAHRIFNPKYIVSLFDQCRLFDFSAISDNNEYIENANIQDFLNNDYSCGLFHFKKNINEQ